ncbi:hypothetical protein [Halorubrum amylolyticum]|uniref:hypothetical protein n=1 Tax=Halorubrum amylolyticum TaxID=2508724 RepID=UPI0013E8BEF4|nr:hypothetical protein [Halorubrum amylolyticum]
MNVLSTALAGVPVVGVHRRVIDPDGTAPEYISEDADRLVAGLRAASSQTDADESCGSVKMLLFKNIII